MDLKLIRDRLVGSKEQRAVSPVIGVILMVAITVILAAVIATFVMDIGDLDKGAPNAQFEWESDGSTYTVTHTSGEDIEEGDITIQGITTGSDDSSDWASSGSTITAGDSVELDPDGDAVTIVWEADDSSTILTEYSG